MVFFEDDLREICTPDPSFEVVEPGSLVETELCHIVFEMSEVFRLEHAQVQETEEASVHQQPHIDLSPV
jgi:hypothetical protein